MKKKLQKGSFTVEASVVVSLICMVIAAFIYQTFLLHDRAVLQDLAIGILDSLETRITMPVSEEGVLDEERFLLSGILEGSRTVEYIDSSEEQERFLDMIRRKTFLVRNPEVKLEVSRKEIRLSVNYQFQHPGGIIGSLLEDKLQERKDYLRKVSIPGRQIVRVGRSVLGR